jgi:hypothetical protein
VQLDLSDQLQQSQALLVQQEALAQQARKVFKA